MYMPLISPAWIAFMISTTVRPFCGSSSWPQNASRRRSAGHLRSRPTDNPERPSGSVRRRRRPARCSGRAADAARCRAADLAGDQRQRDQAAGIVGAMDMLADAHAPENDRGLGAAYSRATSRSVSAVDAADRRHLLGRELVDASPSALRSPRYKPAMYCSSYSLSVMITLSMALSIATRRCRA